MSDIFSTILTKVKSIDLCKKHITIKFYGDCTYANVVKNDHDETQVTIGYGTDCCESAWFEQYQHDDGDEDEDDVNEDEDKEDEENRQYMRERAKAGRGKDNGKELTYDNAYIAFADLVNRRICAVKYTKNISLPYSGRDDYDVNQVYKVMCDDNSYTYFVFRCSSNGYYQAYLTFD